MLTLSYNLSSNLQNFLKSIENSRKNILLTPLSPRVENRLKWEATLQKIYWSLTLEETPLTKAHMQRLLYKGITKKLKKDEKDVLNYNEALNYIKQYWFVSNNKLSSNTIRKLHGIACKTEKEKDMKDFNANKDKIQKYLDYLQDSYENPVIQAGISMIQILLISPFKSGNSKVARLSADLLLYQNGYDFRGLLFIEEFFRSDLMTYNSITKSPRNSITRWLEYFSYGVSVQLKKIEQDLKNISFRTDIPASFWKLNERQRQIMLQLEKPSSKITNKDVQKKFKISQITASRDLSKLHNLGLVLSLGDGRSRLYIKS